MDSITNSNSLVGDFSPQLPQVLHTLKHDRKILKEQNSSMDELQNAGILYGIYVGLGFKPIRCKGYHPQYNSKRDYKTAKEPVNKGFTSDTYPAPDLSEIEEWENRNGWTGWLIPKGYIALDLEDPWSIKYLEDHFIATGVKPLIHKTNNGKHYFFKMTGDLPATTEVYTKLGVKVTYRVGGKNYLIMAPINGRRWEL